jgi:spermidine/putrescine transport system substrate-binding protein
MSNLPPSRMTRRRFIQNGILSAAGLGLSQAATGCGWRLGNVRQPVVGAGSSQELFLYTWAQYVDQKLITDFQQQSGLRTGRELFDSNEKMLTAIQAGKGANFSVLYPSEYFRSGTVGPIGSFPARKPRQHHAAVSAFPR